MAALKLACFEKKNFFIHFYSHGEYAKAEIIQFNLLACFGFYESILLLNFVRVEMFEQNTPRK